MEKENIEHDNGQIRKCKNNLCRKNKTDEYHFDKCDDIWKHPVWMDWYLYRK